MGSDSFFSKLVSYDPINQLSGDKLGTYLAPGVGKYNNVGAMNDPTKGASPQSGVAPTLAAANQGYQVAPTGAGTNLPASAYGMNPSSGNVGTSVPTNPVGTTPPLTSSPTVTTGAGPKATNPYTMALQKQAAGGGIYGQ